MTSRNIRLRQRKTSDSFVEVGGSRIGVISNKVMRNDISRQLDETETFSIGLGSVAEQVLTPPYALKNIHDCFEKSNILRQCVTAYVTNIVMNGYIVVPYAEGVAMDAAEKAMLDSFIETANSEESLITVMAKYVFQYEKFGFSFLEVVRDAKGQPSLVRFQRASNTRLMGNSKEEVNATYWINRGGKRTKITERRRFRRYVQRVGSQTVYFKEFGDPRRMSYKTGLYESNELKVADNELATELIHGRQYSEDAYGLPRWISQLPSIFGSREAEEVNLRYFEDNTVPPMMLTISGGRLTGASYRDLTQILQGRGLGRERQHQVVIVEAVPELTDIDGKGSVQIKVEKLAESRQSDGLFKAYDEQNQNKVRSTFRLPPVFIGMSQDITFATANVSAYLAEVQVFVPERAIHDETLNKRLVNSPKGLNLKTVKLQSRGPSLSAPDDIIKALTALNVMGAVTPRSAVETVNKQLQMGIPDYPAEGEEGYMEWMDKPIQLSVRETGTQQTGEGDTTRTEQQLTPAQIKQQQQKGGVAPEGVENGQQ